MTVTAVAPTGAEIHPVHVNTPDAYESIITVGQRQIHSDEDMARIIDGLYANPDFNPDLLATEEAHLGVRYQDDPAGFRLAHNKFLMDFKDGLQDIYPEVVAKTVEQVAVYLGKGDTIATDRWRQELQARASTLTGVYASDHLTRSMRGIMLNFSRSIVITSRFALMEDQVEARRQLEEEVLPHEVIHLLSTSAVAERAMPTVYGAVNLPVRTGVNTVHRVAPEDDENAQLHEHGTWANEALTEDFRCRALNGEAVFYSRGVALLRTLKDLDPTLEQTMDDSLMGETAPAAVTGKIEDILGPLGIEAIQPFVSDEVFNHADKRVEYKFDEETFVQQVVDMVQPHMRGSVEASLRHHLAGIRPVTPLPPNLASRH